MNIGFSTGSLAKGDFRFAIKVLSKSNANVVELSALRESELEDFSLHQLKRVTQRRCHEILLPVTKKF